MPLINGEFRRENGFEFPLDRLQVTSYILFGFMVFSYYSLLVPLCTEVRLLRFVNVSMCFPTPHCKCGMYLCFSLRYEAPSHAPCDLPD